MPEQGVRLTARDWCDKYANGYLDSKAKCVSETVAKFGVGFKYSICRMEGCVGEAQHMKRPLGDDGPSCKEIMLENNWQKCKCAAYMLKL